MEFIRYGREIPVIGQYDVIVAGGGPAGVAAAVSSAREGVKTLLVERHGVLGGNLTVGHICPLLGSVSRGTMYDEISKLLTEDHPGNEGVVTRNGREIPVDPEEAKIKLMRLVAHSGAEVMLCTSVADVLMNEKNVEGLVLNTPKGLAAVRGKVIIDATGDGQAAYLAGAKYSIGREPDGKTQPVTIEFTVSGVDESRGIAAWGGSDPVKLPSGQEYRELCREKNAAGELPENVTIVRLHRTAYPGERSVNATQLNGINPLDPVELGRAENELRGQVGSCVTFLRKYVPGYENCVLKSSAGVLGVRETRRITGDETVCDSDVETGFKRPDDVVVHNAWFLIDIHNPAGGGQAEGHSQPAIPYDIPYGAMLPEGIEGLVTAGRCISGTHRAHASYRVMSVCFAMGEAAGAAAAIAAKRGRTPREIGAALVQKLLTARGVELFN